MKQNNRIGHFVTESSQKGETYKSYIPTSLPPDPPLKLKSLLSLFERASVSLGELNGIRANLPSPDLFFKTFAKKEAVLSSQIEGTQSSLSDFLHFESKKDQDHKDNVDEIEVKNYISAMNYGLQKVQTLPLSQRLMCEIHARLLSSGRGAEKHPGSIRVSQNWIGGTRPGNAIFVPPPSRELARLLSNLEKFIHSEEPPIPVLIKTALVHVQFETIHPFLDGNGRLGRLLISFMLCLSKLLKEPLLYLSLYFKQNREEYYRLLQEVRTEGNWEAWIEFFLTGVDEVSKQATTSAQEIVLLFKRDREKIKAAKKDSAGVLKTYDCLKRQAVSQAIGIREEAKISHQTVLRSLRILKALGIVEEETTNTDRNKIFTYKQYLQLIDKGTEVY